MFHVKHHLSISPFNKDKITKIFGLNKFLTFHNRQNKKRTNHFGQSVPVFSVIATYLIFVSFGLSRSSCIKLRKCLQSNL